MTTNTVDRPRWPDRFRGLARPSRALRPASAAQGLIWALVVVLVVGPLVPLVYASVRNKPFYLPGGAFSLDGYSTLFADPAFWEAVRNTVLFALLTTVLAVAGGTAFAILCNRTNLPGRKLYAVLLLAPIVIPPLGLIVGSLALYGQSGYITVLVGDDLNLPVWNLSSIPGMAVPPPAAALPLALLTSHAALARPDSPLADPAPRAGPPPPQRIRPLS